MRPAAVLALSFLLLGAPLLPLPSAAVQASPVDYLVYGVPVADLGSDQVIDDYGAFVTAQLTPDRAQSLAAWGASLEPLDHSVTRGRIRTDPILLEPDALAGDDHYVVQFRGPIKEEWRERLEGVAQGVYEYLPNHAYLVRLTAEGYTAIGDLPQVRTVIPYAPDFKVAPQLPLNGPVKATIIGFPDASLDRLTQSLVATRAIVVGAATTTSGQVLDAWIDAAALPAIARMTDVAWIEPAGDGGSLDNEQASALAQAGTLDGWPLHARGVDGRTQVVSICDTGANTNLAGSTVKPPPMGPLLKMTHETHDDQGGLGMLAYNAHLLPGEPLPAHRKVDLYFSPQEAGNRGDARDDDGHGTHTAATLAGDAPPYGVRNAHDGIAFASKLVVCDIVEGNRLHILDDYTHYWDPAYARGARIHSNSWGASPTSAYTEKARQHDAYVWSHRDFTILRSMGNGGADSIMRPEAAAKNVLAVGATHNGALHDLLSSTSTGGPAADGRTKPDLVAPGRCLISAYVPGPSLYECLSGTSMATPLVAGAAALVRDYFAQGFYPLGQPRASDGFQPSAALVKAVLLSSGREIGGDGDAAAFPNDAQGWGRLALDDALAFAGERRRLLVVDEEAGLRTGETQEFHFSVTGSTPLRVLIAWTDAPAAPGAAAALVNDLDLSLKGPGSSPVHGTSTGSARGPAGDRDNLNVQEAIFLAEPKPGSYVVRILGANVPQGPQPFALVATGEVEWAQDRVRPAGPTH